MRSLTIAPQITAKSFSAGETRRTHTISSSQKSPISIEWPPRFMNFTSRFRMSVDNGGPNRSRDRIGAEDAVIIVDHGSRRRESNLMLNEFVAIFRDKTDYPIVEPAHMDPLDAKYKTNNDILECEYWSWPNRQLKPRLHRASNKGPNISLLARSSSSLVDIGNRIFLP